MGTTNKKIKLIWRFLHNSKHLFLLAIFFTGITALADDENEGRLSSMVQENLTGVRVVRSFGRENQEREKFHSQNRQWKNTMMLLLDKLYPLTKGRVTIGGVDIQKIKQPVC